MPAWVWQWHFAWAWRPRRTNQHGEWATNAKGVTDHQSRPERWTLLTNFWALIVQLSLASSVLMLAILVVMGGSGTGSASTNNSKQPAAHNNRHHRHHNHHQLEQQQQRMATTLIDWPPALPSMEPSSYSSHLRSISPPPSSSSSSSSSSSPSKAKSKLFFGKTLAALVESDGRSSALIGSMRRPFVPRAITDSNWADSQPILAPAGEPAASPHNNNNNNIDEEDDNFNDAILQPTQPQQPNNDPQQLDNPAGSANQSSGSGQQQQQQQENECALLLNIRNNRPSSMFRHIVSAAYGFVFFLGLLGNFITLLVLLREWNTCSVIDIFIGNLALSDIMLCIFAVPITPIYMLYEGHWTFGLAICKGLSFAQCASVYISTFTLIIIAVVRHRMILRPLSWQLTRGWAFLCCLATWTCGAIITVPYLHHVGLMPENCDIKFCDELWDGEYDRFYFSVATLVNQFFVPLGLIGYLHVGIFRRLNAQVHERRHQRAQEPGRNRRPTLTAAASHTTNGTPKSGPLNGRLVGGGVVVSGKQHHHVDQGHNIHDHNQQQQQQHHNQERKSWCCCCCCCPTGATPTQATTMTADGPLQSSGASASECCARCGGASGSMAAPVETSFGLLASSRTLSRLDRLEPTLMPAGSSCELAPPTGHPLRRSVSAQLHEPVGSADTVCRCATPTAQPLPPGAEASKASCWFCCLSGHGKQQQQHQQQLQPLAGQQPQPPTASSDQLGAPTGNSVPSAPATITQQRQHQHLQQQQQQQQQTASSSTTHNIAIRLDVFALKEQREREKERRISATNWKLFLMVLLFTCSWLPLNVFNLVQDYFPKLAHWLYIKHVFLLVHLVACSSVCVNPILYAWMSDNYRQKLCQVLPRWFVSYCI